jgi:hypothetical protein
VTDAMPYQALADAVLALHVAIVLFVVGGLLLVVLGNLRGWPWVNALWFRLAHLATIGIVVAEAWFGIVCPLTTLEMWLRSQARVPTYDGSFIELAYSLFGLAVVASWWYFPPRPRNGRKHPPKQEASP